jgi:hypothetical protein
MMTTDPEIVCLLDLLGFESLLGRLDLAGLQQRYTLLVDGVRQQTGGRDRGDIRRTCRGRLAHRR